uniref:Uncharacterized protein LOC104247264 n=1 Tax=Nicotiana sylvestris TaxID=4096 RepID=A0A1U7YHW4_NICSY
MARTRATGQCGRPPMPPTEATKGRGRCRGRGRGRAARVAHVDLPVAPAPDQAPAIDAPAAPSQREELHRQFEWLRQGDVTASQYEARFSELARYASWIVSTDRERIKRFVDGLNYHLHILMTRERVLGISFEDAVDITRDIETFQQDRGRSFRPAQSARPEYRGGPSCRGYQGSQQSQPSLSALPAQSSSRAPSSQ